MNKQELRKRFVPVAMVLHVTKQESINMSESKVSWTYTVSDSLRNQTRTESAEGSGELIKMQWLEPKNETC